MWILILIVSSLIALIYLWIQCEYQFFEKHGFSYVKPTFPIGSIKNVGQTEHLCDFSRREYENHKNKGPAFGVFMIMRKSLFITDPDLIKDILVKHFDNFHQRGVDIDFKNDPLSGNLFFLDGQDWKNMRAKLSPTFTSGRIKMMFPIVSETADGMVEYLMPYVEEDESLNVQEVYASFTTEVIANIAFGLEIKCHGDPNNEFRKIAHEMFEQSLSKNLKQLFMISFPKISSMLGMSFNSQKTIDFFTKVVRENIEYRERNNIQRNDFFQLLINIKNSEVGMTLNEIAANSFVFFLAGLETSSSVMTFCTYELALNQDIQDRLRKEIEKILEKYNGEVTYDAILEMKYLDMVFNETLRKHPIIDNQNRRAVKDFPIPNTNLVIPAGMHILIPIPGIHNDERFYENPDQFNPERFTEENVKKRHPFTFIPFCESENEFWVNLFFVFNIF